MKQRRLCLHFSVGGSHCLQVYSSTWFLVDTVVCGPRSRSPNRDVHDSAAKSACLGEVGREQDGCSFGGTISYLGLTGEGAMADGF